MSRQTREWVYQFRGHQAFPLTASGVGTPWVKADTSAAGTPTMVGLNSGGLRMQLDSGQTEVENLCLYFGDKLSFDIDDIIRFWAIVAGPAAVDAATTIMVGMASARNDALASLSACALFYVTGSNAILARVTDGTNTQTAIGTGLTLGTSWKRVEANLAERNVTVDPPGLSTGRKSNIGLYGSNANGSLRRVASGKQVNMSAYTAGLQPYLQIQKTSAANGDNLDILEFGVEYNVPY